MSKRLILVLAMIVVLVSGLVAGCAAPAPAPPAPAPVEVIEWRFPGTGYRGTWHWDEVEVPLFDMLETMTDGRLDLKIWAAEELVAEDESFEATKAGVMDMHYCWGKHLGEVPFNEVEYCLPLGLKTWPEFNILWHRKGGYEIGKKAYLAAGVHLLPPQIVATICPIVHSAREIRTLDDMKGLKMRGYGGFATIAEKLGASVVWVPYGELYTALMTGVIDGCAGPCVADNVDLKLYESTKWLVLPSLMPSFIATLFANLDSWNALPEDLQTTLYMWALYSSQRADMVWADYTQRAYAELKAQGVTLVTLPPEDVAVLTEMSQPIWDEMAAKDPSGYGAEFVELSREYARFLGYIK